MSLNEQPKSRVRFSLSVPPFSRLRLRTRMTPRAILIAALALFLIIASLWTIHTYPTIFKPIEVPATPGELGPDSNDRTSYTPAAGADDPAVPSSVGGDVPADSPALTSTTEPPTTMIPAPTMAVPATAAPSTASPATAAPAESAPVVAAPTSLAWPLRGQTLTSFGIVHSVTLDDWRQHDGIDLEAVSGSPVHAAAAGTVLSVGQSPSTGTTIVIDHGGGLTTVYGALLLTSCHPGDRVKAGIEIGRAGNTALTEVALPIHLHFEVRLDGTAVDPLTYLK